MNLTHQNHLKWTINGKPYATRTSDSEKFSLKMGSVPKFERWGTELENSTRKLIDDHGKNLALFYSGGADSELVVRSLLKCGVVPDIHIIQFENRLNEHEVHNAFQVCDELGLKAHVWNHDVLKYIRDQQYTDLAVKYQCSQIAYLTVLEYARRVTDKPVIMGGEVYLQKHQRHSSGAVHADPSWYYIYREDEDGVTYRYSYDTGHPVINEFFTYTPELLASWLSHPMVTRITTTNIEPGKITFLSLKRGIYEHEIGYELAAKTKFHGYEALGWVNMFVQRKLKEQFPTSQICKYEYNQLVRDLCTPQS